MNFCDRDNMLMRLGLIGGYCSDKWRIIYLCIFMYIYLPARLLGTPLLILGLVPFIMQGGGVCRRSDPTLLLN